MIAKVTRGDGPGGAVRYLFSAGRHNEHEDPHVVAAAAALGVTDGLRPSEVELKDLEAAMEAPSALYGNEEPRGVCWHLALSTKGGVDRDLSDEEWAAVAREAVCQLGFDTGDCRWVAVRHGPSGAGNDHIHLVVNLVREDGKVASTRNDFRRLSALCTAMERRYGLFVVEGRANKAAMPGLTRAEVEKARTAPDRPKRNGASSPGWCGLRRLSPAAKPSSCGCSGTPGWRPGPVTIASAGIGWSATRWPRSHSTGGWRSSSVGGSWRGTSRSRRYGNAGETVRPRARRQPPSGPVKPRLRACTRRLGPAGTSPTAGPRPESAGVGRHLGKSTRRPPSAPRPAGKSGGRPRRSGAPAWRRPRRGGNHLAGGRLRRGGGAGCFIGAFGALPGAARPRLGSSSPDRPKGRGKCQRRKAMSRGAPSSRWPPSWPKRTSTRTRRPPGGFSWPRCSGWHRRSTMPTWRALRPSRRAVLPRRRGKALDKARARLGSREALRAELPAVVEAARRGGGTGTRGGRGASAPPGGQKCAAATAIRRDDNEAGSGEAVVGSGAVSVIEAVLGTNALCLPTGVPD